MTAPKPLTSWQAANLPESLPLHVRRNIAPGTGGCWLWTRSRSRDGYGWASLANRTHQAHRLVYVLVRGDPPAGLQLDHLCRVRHCVNPAHLQPVDAVTNLLRSPLTTAGRATCERGHALAHTGHQRRCPKCWAEHIASRRDQKIRYLRNYRKRRREAATC